MTFSLSTAIKLWLTTSPLILRKENGPVPMCLTEPHAGTDLGIISTKGNSTGRRNVRVSGTKIFITYGEHDMTDNIVHLVLAKTPESQKEPKESPVSSP